MRQPATRPLRLAALGECLIELVGAEFGSLRQSFGGDTLNTAVYLARLLEMSAVVQYVTVLGSDTLSDRMAAAWQTERIDVSLALRDTARLPGLYQVQVDGNGERRFFYWRQNSAARFLLRHPEVDRVLRALAEVDLLYLSGISLAILPAEDRARLVELLLKLGASGVAIAFDTNFRPALWPADAARACITSLLPAIRIVFATDDDEKNLWGEHIPRASVARYAAARIPSIIIKRGSAGCLYSDGAQCMTIAASRVDTVIDTTAAGDSFNAGFLAAWVRRLAPARCCQAGNALAGVVIGHPGAIIPGSQTPTLEQLLNGCAAATPRS